MTKFDQILTFSKNLKKCQKGRFDTFFKKYGKKLTFFRICPKASKTTILTRFDENFVKAQNGQNGPIFGIWTYHSSVKSHSIELKCIE